MWSDTSIVKVGGPAGRRRPSSVTTFDTSLDADGSLVARMDVPAPPSNFRFMMGSIVDCQNDSIGRYQ